MLIEATHLFVNFKAIFDSSETSHSEFCFFQTDFNRLSGAYAYLEEEDENVPLLGILLLYFGLVRFKIQNSKTRGSSTIFVIHFHTNKKLRMKSTYKFPLKTVAKTITTTNRNYSKVCIHLVAKAERDGEKKQATKSKCIFLTAAALPLSLVAFECIIST